MGLMMNGSSVILRKVRGEFMSFEVCQYIVVPGIITSDLKRCSLGSWSFIGSLGVAVGRSVISLMKAKASFLFGVIKVRSNS